MDIVLDFHLALKHKIVLVSVSVSSVSSHNPHFLYSEYKNNLVPHRGGIERGTIDRIFAFNTWMLSSITSQVFMTALTIHFQKMITDTEWKMESLFRHLHYSLICCKLVSLIYIPILSANAQSNQSEKCFYSFSGPTLVYHETATIIIKIHISWNALRHRVNVCWPAKSWGTICLQVSFFFIAWGCQNYYSPFKILGNWPFFSCCNLFSWSCEKNLQHCFISTQF